MPDKCLCTSEREVGTTTPDDGHNDDDDDDDDDDDMTKQQSREPNEIDVVEGDPSQIPLGSQSIAARRSECQSEEKSNHYRKIPTSTIGGLREKEVSGLAPPSREGAPQDGPLSPHAARLLYGRATWPVCLYARDRILRQAGMGGTAAHLAVAVCFTA